MKPFNLKEALSGKPVKLRNGMKALICYRIPDEYVFNDGSSAAFPLQGIIFNKRGNLKQIAEVWRDNGTYGDGYLHKFDIIGMWEEPKLTLEELMEKAFQEKLILTHDIFPPRCKGFKVVGKTLDNDYILQNCDDNEIYFSNVFRKDGWSIKE